MPVWQLCVEGQVCTKPGYNAPLPIRNKVILCWVPNVILLKDIRGQKPGGLTTWQSWREGPLQFKVGQASCWILPFLHAFHSWFSVTSSHWSLFMQHYVSTTLVVAPLARLPPITFSCAWWVASVAMSGGLEESVWNPWKSTVLLSTKPRSLNIPKRRLLIHNSLYFKDGHFSQWSSIRGYLMLLCAHTWLTTGSTFKRSRVQF